MIGKTVKRCALSLLLIAIITNHALAHSPHDPIRALDVSPAFMTDQTLFLVVSNTLMISTDGGESWKKLANGLDYKDQLTSLAVSPMFAEDRTVFVASGGDGVYRSEDGGRSWAKVNSGLPSSDIHSVHLSPRYHVSHMVIAVSAKGVLHVSSDKGDNWHRAANVDAAISCLIFLPGADPETLLAGTVEGRLFSSEDAGMSWRPLLQLADCGAVTCLAAPQSPDRNRAIFVGTEKSGVLKVDLADGRFEQIGTGLNNTGITSLWAQTTNNVLRLYASSDEGFYSFDANEGGWENRSNGLTTDIQAKDPAFLAPNFKGISASEDSIFLGGYDGLFKSSDRGQNWRQLDTLSPGIITGLSVLPTTSKSSYNVALATYGGGAYLFSSRDRKWTVINNGLSWTRLNDMAFSPAYDNDGILFSGSENNFLVFDGKSTAWQTIPVSRSFRTRVKDKLKHYLRKLGMSADRANSFFGYLRTDAKFPTSVAPSPAIDKDGTVYFGTRGSGLYLSEDRGRTNKMLWDAENGLITSLCVSPKLNIDGTLFAGIYDMGVFKSTDKGKSWENIGVDLEFSGEIHLTISKDYENDKTIVMGSQAGLYLSADGGAKWRRIDTGSMTGPITCVAISPDYAEDGTIIAGVMGSGLWISSDRGTNFSRFAAQLIQSNYQAKFIQYSAGFRQDSTMYCATSFELFRSTDKGRTWQHLGRPLRFEDFREEIRYEGQWNKKDDEVVSALTETFSKAKGSSAKLHFVGTGINWIGTKSSEHGNADVFIDGVFAGRVSQKFDSPIEEKGQIVFNKSGLENRSHEIVIKAVCPDQQQSCGWISIDALETEY
jgi:photosystem II stability/assembly factor-like uncharacterized protein